MNLYSRVLNNFEILKLERMHENLHELNYEMLQN
jgi:hypothetical protein